MTTNPRLDAQSDTVDTLAGYLFVARVAATPSSDRVAIVRQSPGASPEDCPALDGVATTVDTGDDVLCAVAGSQVIVVGKVMT